MDVQYMFIMVYYCVLMNVFLQIFFSLRYTLPLLLPSCNKRHIVAVFMSTPRGVCLRLDSKPGAALLLPFCGPFLKVSSPSWETSAEDRIVIKCCRHCSRSVKNWDLVRIDGLSCHVRNNWILWWHNSLFFYTAEGAPLVETLYLEPFAKNSHSSAAGNYKQLSSSSLVMKSFSNVVKRKISWPNMSISSTFGW